MTPLRALWPAHATHPAALTPTTHACLPAWWLPACVQAGADRASVKEYQRLVGCALELCPEGDAAAVAQLQPLAIAACAEFIRSPVLFQVRLRSCGRERARAAAQDAGPGSCVQLPCSHVSVRCASYRRRTGTRPPPSRP